MGIVSVNTSHYATHNQGGGMDTEAVAVTSKNSTHKLSKIQVIINPAAGVDRPILGLLNTEFGNAGIEWDARITHKAGDAIKFAKEAVEAGCNMVAAHGGDGTVMEVACALHGTDVPLAIFPGGTGNVMAAELGIAYDLATAIGFVARGEYDLRTVDMAEVNKQHKFLLRTVIGFEADMVNNTSQELKNRFGLLAYAFTALNQLRELQPTSYKIKVDGRDYSAEGVSAMIANSSNVALGGMTFSQKVDVSDGLLDLIVFTNANLNTLLNVTTTMVAGADATERPEVLHWQGREISIDPLPPQSIAVYGDMIDSSKVTACILPGGVRVAVPRTAPTTQETTA
jgi:diacylglycerol kinase (ATP)